MSIGSSSIGIASIGGSSGASGGPYIYDAVVSEVVDVFHTYSEVHTGPTVVDETVADEIQVTLLEDLPPVNKVVSLLNNVSVDDMTTYDAIIAIIEAIEVSGAWGNYANLKNQVDDVTVLADLVQIAYQIFLTSDVDVLDSLSDINNFMAAVVDVVAASDVSASVATLNVAVAVAAALFDYTGDVTAVSENVAVSSALMDLIHMALSVADTLTASESLSTSFTLFTLADDTIDVSDSLLSSYIAFNTLSDNITFTTSFFINGIEYSGWVMNPENYAISNYSNYPFNSNAYFSNQYLYANSTGLYSLGGTLDEAETIQAIIKTAAMDFDTSNRKQVPEVLLGVNNSSRVILQVSVDGDTSATYELIPSSSGLSTQQIKVGKGLHGRYWQFELTTKQNSTFDLDSFEFLPVVFGRKT